MTTKVADILEKNIDLDKSCEKTVMGTFHAVHIDFR